MNHITCVIGKEKTVLKLASETLDPDCYGVTEKGSLVLNYDNPDSQRFAYHCSRTTSTLLNPIIDWSDSDVWEFLSYYGCRSNPLYECGYKRVGCIGCPMGSTISRMREFERYPKYKAHYIRAFDRMIKTNTDINYTWDSGNEVFQWWLGITVGQMSFFDEMENAF